MTGARPQVWNIEGLFEACKKHPVGGSAFGIAPDENSLRHTQEGNSEIRHWPRFCFKNTQWVWAGEESAATLPSVTATSKWPTKNISFVSESKHPHDISGAGDKRYLKRWEGISLKAKTAYVLCSCSRLTPTGIWNSLKHPSIRWHWTAFILDAENKALKKNVSKSRSLRSK